MIPVPPARRVVQRAVDGDAADPLSGFFALVDIGREAVARRGIAVCPSPLWNDGGGAPTPGTIPGQGYCHHNRAVAG